MFFFYLRRHVLWMHAMSQKLEISLLVLNVSSLFFFFKNVYTQNTLKGMRIVLSIVDKYDIVHQFSYCCKVNCDKHIDQINIF